MSVASNPEFLREGAAIADFKHPDRIVVGAEDEHAREVLKEIYRPLFLNRAPILFTERRTAELIKYAANAFLAVKISFINEIADLCEAVDADVQDVARGIGLDNRIGPKFLHAGPGYGGSCFPKDTLALLQTAQNGGGRAAHRRHHGRGQRRPQGGDGGAGRARARRHRSRARRIAVLGLAFKPNTDDMRDAPSLPLIAGLVERGASVAAFDPGRPRAGREDDRRDRLRRRCGKRGEGRRRSGHRHRMGRVPRARPRPRSPAAMRGKVLVDLRNVYDQAEADRAGLTYFGVGRGIPPSGLSRPMARKAPDAPERRSLLTRRRFQFAGALVVGALVPFAAAADLPARDRSSRRRRSTPSSPTCVAIAIAFWMRLSIETYPGIRRSAVILPAALTGHGLTLVWFVMTRFPYDRIGLTLGLPAPRPVALSPLCLWRPRGPAAVRGGAVRRDRPAGRGSTASTGSSCAAQACADAAALQCDRRRFFGRSARRMGSVPGRCRARRADRLPGQAIDRIADRPGRARSFVARTASARCCRRAAISISRPRSISSRRVLLLPFALPILAVAALAIRIDSGGPGDLPPAAARPCRHGRSPSTSSAPCRLPVADRRTTGRRGRCTGDDDRADHPRRRIAAQVSGSTSCRRSSTS